MVSHTISQKKFNFQNPKPICILQTLFIALFFIYFLAHSGNIPDDLMVRSEDFFTAIHAIMSIKQNRHRIEGKNLKVKIFLSFLKECSELKKK